MVKDGNTEKTDNKAPSTVAKPWGLAGVWGSKAPDAVNSFFECDNIIPGTDVGMVALRATKKSIDYG